MIKQKHLAFLAIMLVFHFACMHAKAQEAILRFDGMYNTYDTTMDYYGRRATEGYTTRAPVVLLKNNKIFRSKFATTDDTAFKREFYARFVPEEIGTYRIEGDSIFAILPTYFYLAGMRSRLYSTNYSGYIKNQDTIIGWKMVSPYPDVKAYFNKEVLISRSTPELLYFIKNDAVTALEEIAAKEIKTKKSKK